MRGKNLCSVVTVIAALFAVMFAGFAFADIHGKAPPPSITIVQNTISNSMDQIDAGAVNELTVSTGVAVSFADDGNMATVGNPTSGAGNYSFYACAVNNGGQQGTTLVGVAASSSEAWRSFRGAGKVFTGELENVYATQYLITIAFGADDVGDRT